MKANKFKLSYIIAFWPALFFVLIMLCLSTLSGCYGYDTGYYSHKHNNPERVPMIEAVKASCYYNYTYDDYKWYFDAWVHYPRYDFEGVVEVHVDIFDEGYLVDTFPLYHNREKYWESQWIEMTETHLWCGDYYEVEFVAYDHQGNFDIFRTTPYY